MKGELVETYAEPQPDLPHLSYTRMSKYLLCPEQYRLHYVVGLRPRIPSANLVFGGLIHEALCQYLARGENPVEHFRESWKLVEGTELEYSRKDSWQSLAGKGDALLTQFAMTERQNLTEIVATEQSFEMVIPNVAVPFVGTIDLLARFFGKLTVIDFKTAAKAYGEHEAPLSDQLTAYHLIEPRAEQAAYCVLVKTKEPRIEWCVSRRSDVNRLEFLQKASLVCADIQAHRFYRRSGTWCSYCDYLSLCTKQ